MEVVFFNNEDPDTLSCESNEWLIENPGIEIFDIKQSVMPLDNIINPDITCSI